MAKNTKRTDIGERLVNLRKKFGYDQQDIADRLSIKRDTYARYEIGTIPPVSIIKDLSKIYNITSDYLICNDDDSYLSMMRSSASVPILRTSIAYSVNNEPTELTEDEMHLLEIFRNLPQDKQIAMLTLFSDKSLI